MQGPFGHIASMRCTFVMLAAVLCAFVMVGGGLPSRAYGDDGNLIANPTFTNQASGWSTTSPAKKIGEMSSLDLSTKLLNGQRNLKQANGNHFALAWNFKPQGTSYYFEPGSTYTTFSTQSGATYEWGLNHRAATEHDVLMLTMGPQQENLSVNSAGQDQLMQLRTWLKAQDKMPQGNTVERYTVYSDPFAANGGFAGSSADGSHFSFEQSDGRIALSVWLVSSNGQGWFSFGTNSTHYYRVLPEQDDEFAYQAVYTAASENTMLALTCYDSNLTEANEQYREWFGNLVNDVHVEKQGTRDIYTDFGKVYQENSSETMTTLNNYAFSTSNLKNENTNIANGSFEDDIHLGNKSTSKFTLCSPHWRTTETDHRIEIVAQNDYYIDPVGHSVPFAPSDGEYAAELNAHEASSLYQYVTTEPGKQYEWGLDHRGRSGRDAMALIIGPRQENEPYKDNQKALDQYQQIVQWIQMSVDNYVGLDVVNFSQSGCSKKIILYSTKFDKVGGFANASSGSAFSWTADAEHTEKWCVWIMASENDAWASYGSNALEQSKKVDYDYTYTIPDGQNQSVFAFVAYNTANGSNSTGNFLDNISFREFYRIETYTTPNGSGTYFYNANTKTADFTYAKNYVGKQEKNSYFMVDAKCDDGAVFIGAFVNGEFYSADDDAHWTRLEDGTYRFEADKVTKHYKVHLVFSKAGVQYDVNGGKAYHYDPHNESTGDFVQLSGAGASYTSHAAVGQNDDWKFMGWEYAGSGKAVRFDAKHTVTHTAPEGTTDSGTLTIKGKKVNPDTGAVGDAVTVENIPESQGATFVAQWKYRQAFVAQLKNADGTWSNVTTGGTVSSKLKGAKGSIDAGDGSGKDEDAYKKSGVAYFVDDGTFVEAVAAPKEGYHFEGWYDLSNPDAPELLSSSPTYTYNVKDRHTGCVYARFTPRTYTLKVSKSVTGNMGDKRAYFKMTATFTGLKAGQTYAIEYSDASAQGSHALVARPNDRAETVENKTAFTADGQGKATVPFAVKDGLTVSIKALDYNAVYTVSEDDYSSLGYHAELAGASGTLNGPRVTVAVEAKATNSRQVAVPTGITRNPIYALAILAAGVLLATGMVALRLRRGSKRGGRL